MPKHAVTGHRKSRLGCKECKERKVKCDETRPVCVRCQRRSRPCSYEVSASAESFPTPSSQTSNQSLVLDPSIDPGLGHTSIPRPVPTPSIPDLLPTAVFADAQNYDLYYAEQFSLFQLDLIVHLRGPLTDVAARFHQDHLLRSAYGEAFRAPYLMDQLLAYSAAHRSKISHDEESRSFYQTEAIRLQTRALGRLSGGDIQVTDDNVLALFYFSLFLGQQTLADVFTTTPTVSGVLDRLPHCLTLHHGIRSIVARSGGKFEEVLSQRLSHNPIYFTPDVACLPHGNECDSLLQRLNDSDNTDATKAIYIGVVGILRYLFNSVRSDETRKYIVIQEWPVRVSDGYTRLLRQRQPEALVLLSYYAVLLHWANEFWAVQGCGSALIDSISDYLGDCWADWMEWPKSQACMDPISSA